LRDETLCTRDETLCTTDETLCTRFGVEADHADELGRGREPCGSE
jgi:hypothetical protein